MNVGGMNKNAGNEGLEEVNNLMSKMYLNNNNNNDNVDQSLNNNNSNYRQNKTRVRQTYLLIRSSFKKNYHFFPL